MIEGHMTLRYFLKLTHDRPRVEPAATSCKEFKRAIEDAKKCDPRAEVVILRRR